MDPLALTNNARPLTDYSSARVGRAQAKSSAVELSGSAGLSGKSEASSTAVTPDNSGEQKGIRSSQLSEKEFKPYNNTDTNAQDPQIQAVVEELKSTETKVKAHEAAHKAAGGAMTGPVSYSYTRGPDGKSYVTGGEVPISVSPGRTPQETISRMQQVIQAALAPADPSPQDRVVAGQAATQEQQARQQQMESSSTPVVSEPASVKSDASSTTPDVKAETKKSDNYDSSDLPDSITARDSKRAYSDPAVNGKTEENRGGIVPLAGIQTTQTPLMTSGALRTSASPVTPDTITGFGSPQPLSYYA